MARARRAPVVSLITLLRQRFPDLVDPDRAVLDGRVLVDGSSIRNPAARVRRGARIQLLTQRRLRGHAKLEAALIALEVELTGAVALDVGAAAGGFTAALLDRGASRVYAVDAGFGQLVGRLRADPRVVNLERKNLAELEATLVPDVIDVVTVDLSYLSLRHAIDQLERIDYAPRARLLALVQPPFELASGSLVTDAAAVREAIQTAASAIEQGPWTLLGCTLPSVTGANGAVEAFVVARRVAG
jgi:23S rRNA (cytidine1920-2'-O)/16S rRNA (cytidine1409-2'-O)-methyltransferase